VRPRAKLMSGHGYRKLVTVLSLLGYLGLGLGIGTQFVYCVGTDGHSGIERAHDMAHGVLPAGTPALSPAESCTDIPLVVQASKEHERQSAPRNVSDAAYVGRVPAVVPPPRSSWAERRPVVALQRTSTLSSTIIRI